MEAATSSFFDFLAFLFWAFVWTVFISAGAVLAGLAAARFLFRKKLVRRLAASNLIILQIKVPQRNENKEDAMEAVLKSLHRVLPKGEFLSLEMLSSNQILSFYITINRDLRQVIESQLYAAYPEVEVEEVADYLGDLANAAITEMKFKKNSIFSINTYKNLNEDLLKNLSAMLAKTEPGEEVFLQVALRKIGSKPWDRGFVWLWSKIMGARSEKWDDDLFRAKLKVAYRAQSLSQAKAKLSLLISLFKVLKGSANEMKKRRIVIWRDLAGEFRARIFPGGDLFNAAEAATIYHFPYKGATISNVVVSSSKKAPAPDILPRQGMVSEEDVSFFGETNYHNQRVIFGIKRADRRRHVYVVGKTGVGKSRLLELLLISDIWQGKGCCLLDPHGDLADELLAFVPKERIEDVVYVNPADRDFPIGFNPLESVEDYQMRQHLATFFIDIFKKLFQATWNPRMEHMTRYITLALLETPDSNVLGIPRMLSDTTFRQRVIRQIKDPVVKSFWTAEFSTSNERFQNDAIVPILNKVGQFVANPVIRNMVGQTKNVLDFEKFMDEGKIVLINISKGKLGDENAALLGAMFITKIQQAALARAKVPEEKRRDFYFYVDEFQNFATHAFSTILSEARKYHLDLTIAHQYIAQLPEDVKATAFGNVGTVIVFPVGGDDAAYLAKEFAPVFSADDMINLNIREMYIKMSVDGKVTPPFSAKTIEVPRPKFDYSTEIIDTSKMKYGRNRVQVENEIEQWTSSAEFTGSQLTAAKEEFPEPII